MKISMNWSFWTRTPRSHSELTGFNTCDTIDPLLSLYADRMASPDEAHRVEAHLPECQACRESLDWMQATRRALASRPMALPPAGLQAQIARAIAASAAQPLAARPVHVFSMRPAYAAAASLAVLGAVLAGHSLLTPGSKAPMAKAPKVTSPQIASVPTISAPEPATPLPVIHPLAVKHPALARVKAHFPPAERVATLPDNAAVPDETLITPRTETAPTLSEPVKHSVRHEPPHPPLLPVRLPNSHKASGVMMAVRISTPKPPEQARPVPTRMEKPSALVIASTNVTPAVTIGAPTVTPQEPAAVKVAAREGLLGAVKQHIVLMQTVAYSTTRKSIKEAAFVAETGLPDKTPAVGTITHGDWH